MKASFRVLAVVTLAVGALVVASAVFLAGRGGGGGIDVREPDPPVGSPILPDIAPAPPQDAHIKHQGNRWVIRFSTTLANIGEGDFVLRATRGIRDWEVDQDVEYSDSGAKTYVTPAKLAWGGDGHDHWHVQRIAVARLAPFDANGKPPPPDESGRADTKIGFCYYDYANLTEEQPDAVYSRLSCGTQKDTAIGMGLSRGWMDIYPYGLRGQAIDVTDLPDGRYRLWVDVDEKRWFREARRDNNRSWVDLRLVTKASGARLVSDVESGPPIRLGP